MTAPQPPAVPQSAPARATLSRDLGEFLIELSIALNKFAMYPEGHPSLAPAADGLCRRLDRLLSDRGTLSVGVARSQLVIEGVATDSKNPVLRELAGRLHRHHLGAITFSRGVEAGEVLELLRQVSVEADRTQPIGLTLAKQPPGWLHIRLYPLLYDRLELLDEEQPVTQDETHESRSQRTRAAQLWIGMARAALAAEDAEEAAHADSVGTGGGNAPEENEVTTDPTAVARAIEDHPRGTAYDQVIVGYLLQIAEELRSAGGQEALELRKRMSQLISTLSDETLQRLLDMGGDRVQRRKFLLDASQGMAVEAVIDLVRVAAETQEQTVSHSFLRMLQKLARHAEAGTAEGRIIAEQSVREQVADLIRGWSLRDPNPEAYRQSLDALSLSSPLFSVSTEARHAPESRRIVEMALEVDVSGEALRRAVDDLLDKGELKWLVDMLGREGRSGSVEGMWDQIATLERLGQVLREEPFDAALIDTMVSRIGTAAAGPMLDALGELQSAQARRLLLDRLVKLGPDVGLGAAARLKDERWYVKRNMLKIIGDLDVPPPDFRAAEYFQHTDPRVRIEALRILLRDTGSREGALVRALSDPDERVVRLALASALQGCPPTAVSAVSARALTGGTLEVRTAAIRVLGACGARSALDTLLTLTAHRRGMLGRRKPPPKTADYLAALAALQHFRDDPRVCELLAQAARSRDPEIATAASTPPSGQPRSTATSSTQP